MNKDIVALFVEGPTEIEFYKKLVKHIHDLSKTQYNVSLKWVDMKGIGNYKKDALRKFNKIKNNNKDSKIFVFICIDTDVFEYSKKPPINKQTLENSLLSVGAEKVFYIEAKHSIEDWFLCDLEGVLKYLKLPPDTKRPKGNGQEAIQALFHKKNKVYVKGNEIKGFIDCLDISVIISTCCSSIKPLCQKLGFDCKTICGKSKKHY